MTCWSLQVCGRQLYDCGCGNGEVDVSGEACGLPPKTIRAMLAFLVVGVTFLGLIGALVVFAVDGQYDLLLGVIAAMTNIASGSLGYYFGVRSTQGATLKHPLRKLREEEEDSSTAPTVYESEEV